MDFAARAIVADAFDRPCDVFLIALNVPSLPSIIQRAPARQVSFLHPRIFPSVRRMSVTAADPTFSILSLSLSPLSARDVRYLIKTRSKWRLPVSMKPVLHDGFQLIQRRSRYRAGRYAERRTWFDILGTSRKNLQDTGPSLSVSNGGSHEPCIFTSWWRYFEMNFSSQASSRIKYYDLIIRFLKFTRDSYSDLVRDKRGDRCNIFPLFAA